MKVGSLFSGIGGFDLGLERAGFTIAWQVENDPFAKRILERRWPHLTCRPDVREWPRHGDESVDLGNPAITSAARKQQSERIDLLCGGFPCQDLSVAGKRKGLTGERSGLFHEFIRIAQTLKPTWGLVENVPGLFSSCGGRDMATVLEGLRQCWPVVGYRVLDSRYWGVAQRRRRVFFVGGPTERGVSEVLFEAEGGSRDSTPSTEERADLAASLRSRSHAPGVNPPGRGGEDDMNLVPTIQCSGPPGSRRDDEASLVVAATPTGHHPRHNPTKPPGSQENSSTTVGGNAHGVRRLTPTECERLQGFPDGWTCLCQPIESYDSRKCRCPDGPRYKTLGNAVTVPVIQWIGKRLMETV